MLSLLYCMNPPPFWSHRIDVIFTQYRKYNLPGHAVYNERNSDEQEIYEKHRDTVRFHDYHKDSRRSIQNTTREHSRRNRHGLLLHRERAPNPPDGSRAVLRTGTCRYACGRAVFRILCRAHRLLSGKHSGGNRHFPRSHDMLHSFRAARLSRGAFRRSSFRSSRSRRGCFQSRRRTCPQLRGGVLCKIPV